MGFLLLIEDPNKLIQSYKARRNIKYSPLLVAMGNYL
jgi:hypothetical protein